MEELRWGDMSYEEIKCGVWSIWWEKYKLTYEEILILVIYINKKYI